MQLNTNIQFCTASADPVRNIFLKQSFSTKSNDSHTGRTEYQLLLMKASDRGRNLKFQVIILVVFEEFNY